MRVRNHRFAVCALAPLALCFAALQRRAQSGGRRRHEGRQGRRSSALIQQKADVNAPQADGATALQWAAYRNDLDAGGPADRGRRQREDSPIATARRRCRWRRSTAAPPMIEKLLKAGADPNERGPQGETPLMLAARNGNLDAIKVLLDHNADVNAKEKLRGTTALMWAAEQGIRDAVKLLIDHGADVAAVQSDSRRPARAIIWRNPVTQRLNSALRRGQRTRAVPRLARGTRSVPDAPATAGRRPLRLERQPRQTAAARAAEARTRRPGRGSRQLARTSLSSGRSEIWRLRGGWRNRRLRLWHSAEPRCTDGGGLTPLVLAAREDCLECAKASARRGRQRQPDHQLRLDPAADGDPEPALQARRVPARPRRQSEHRQQGRLDAAVPGHRQSQHREPATIRCARRTWITWTSSSCCSTKAPT